LIAFLEDLLMRSRLTFCALALVLAAAGCGKDSPTTPTPDAAPKFTVTLLPSNEVPAVSNADAAGSGTATVILNTTKDGSGNITAATADFTVTLSGFPASTTLTGAHIHPGAAGANGSVVVSLGLTSGEIVLANGSQTFSRNGITVDAALAQTILNNPAGYYFNVHTTINTGGAARGQLVRVN
jgi:CHRD domain